MKKILCLFVLIVASSCVPSQEEATTVESALTTSACTSLHPGRTVDVHFTNHVCIRYTMPASDNAWTAHYLIDSTALGYGAVTSFQTGMWAAAWACDSEFPAGFSQAPYTPCWPGVAVRVRGPLVNGIPQQGSGDVVGIFGRSFVISPGFSSVGQTSCPYLQVLPYVPPLNFHACGTTSNSGQADWRANYDPSDSTNCCNVSGTWPDGSSGAPCMGYGGDGNYAILNYICP